MTYQIRTIAFLLFASLSILAQRQGLNMQFLASYEQTVDDFVNYSHNNLAIHGVALHGEWMHLNAQINFEGTGIGNRLIVARMESPWNISYVADRGGEVFDFPGFARRYDNSLYLTSRNIGGMLKYDVSAPSAPVFGSYIWGAGDLSDLVKAGNYLYAVRTQVDFGWPPASMLILRDDPSSLTHVTEVTGIGSLRGIATDGSYLFVSSDSIDVDNSGIRIFDISQTPEAPQEVVTLPTPGVPRYLAYENELLYIASGDSGLVILDVTDRLNPQILSHTTGLGTLNKLEKRGDLIYSLGTSLLQNRISIIDVSDVNQPLEVGYHIVDGTPLDMSAGDSLLAVVHGNTAALYRYVTDEGPILSFSNTPIKQNCLSTANLYQNDAFTLHNTGNADLVVSNVLSSDSSITVDATSFTIAPGAERSLTVNFHFLGSTAAPDYLVFEHNGVGSPDTVRLHGCDYPPSFGLWSSLQNPYSGHDFGSVTIGDVIDLDETPYLSNYTDYYLANTLDPHTIGTVVSEHPDLSISPQSYRLPKLATVNFNTIFTPSEPGDYSMTLRFDHNTSHEPRYVTYTATVVGAPPAIAVIPTSIFASVAPEQTTADTLTIHNQATNQLSLSYTIASTVDWLSVSPDSGVLDSSGSQDIVLSFDAAGLPADLYTTDLIVASNDPDNPEIAVPVEFDVVDDPVIEFSADTLTAILEEADSMDIKLQISNIALNQDLVWSASAFDYPYNNNSGIAAPGWVALIGDTSGVILPGDSATLTLRIHKLLADAELEGYLKVSSNSVTNPFDIIPIFLTTIGSPTAIKIDDRAPDAFSLGNNYPNPFNPHTTIEYQVASIATVNLAIYNNLGQLVRVLVKEPATPGTYQIQWDGRDSYGREVSSGIYFYQLQADGFRAVKKMMLMR